MTKRIPRELLRDLEWSPDKEVPKREPPQPEAVHEPAVSIDEMLRRGEAFYDAKLPQALRNAQAHAGADGYVATLPELLQVRARADRKHLVWKEWYAALSDEYVGPGPDGAPVVIVLHGGGLLTPERIERAYEDGLTTDTRAARLDEGEWLDLLDGKLPDGTMIPMYAYDDFTASAGELPRRYGVIIDFEVAKSTFSGLHDRESFLANPLAVARSGGEETAAAYFDRAQSGGKLGCWHPFGSGDPSEAQGRVLFVDVNNVNYDGLGGNGLDYYGRFLGVQKNA